MRSNISKYVLITCLLASTYSSYGFISASATVTVKKIDIFNSPDQFNQYFFDARNLEKGFIFSGGGLVLGGSICSANKKFKLVFQKDGNLCIYKAGPNNQKDFVWCNNKYNFGQNDRTRIVMQSDGNLVIYKNGYKDPVWATNTKHPADFVLQPRTVLLDDGNLVVQIYNNTLWNSKSGNQQTNYTFSDCSK